jgi:hypothetical protein
LSDEEYTKAEIVLWERSDGKRVWKIILGMNGEELLSDQDFATAEQAEEALFDYLIEQGCDVQDMKMHRIQ